MSKAKTSVSTRSKAPSITSSKAEDEFARMEREAFGGKISSVPPKAAAKKSTKAMTEAEMKEEINRLMGGKKSASTPANVTTAATVKGISKSTNSKSPRAAPLSPVSPLSPLPASPAVSGKARSPVSPQAQAPAVQTLLKPLHVPISPKAATSTATTKLLAKKEPAPVEEEEDEDYYNEDFDEGAATIDEEEEMTAAVDEVATNKVFPAADKAAALLIQTTATATTAVAPKSPRFLPVPVSTLQPVTRMDQKESLPLSPRSAKAALSLNRADKTASDDITVSVPLPRRVLLPSSEQVLDSLHHSENVRRFHRSREILKRVQLAEENFDLYSVHTISKYDQYMRELGRGEKRNQPTQYNDDWRNQESQTDDVDTFSLHVQVPEDSYATRRNLHTDPHNISSDTITEKDGDGNDAALTSKIGWLNGAAQVIESLILENLNQAAQTNINTLSLGNLNLIASSGALAAVTLGKLCIKLPTLFGPRTIKDVHFSGNRNSIIAIAYSRVLASLNETDADRADDARGKYEGLANKGLICLWDLTKLQHPSKILYCDGDISCCAIDPVRGHLVLAGLESGSLALWDLREAASLHRSCGVKSSSSLCILRHASYTTDGDFTQRENNENHPGRVTKINFIVKTAKRHNEDKKKKRNEQHNNDADYPDDTANDAEPPASSRSFDFLSFSSSTSSEVHMASLDDSGLLITWTAVEVKDTATSLLAGSEADLGLAIGARVKIVRTHSQTHSETRQKSSAEKKQAASNATNKTKNASINWELPLSALSTHARDIQFNCGDTSEYIIALSRGELARCKLHGSDPNPSRYYQFSASSSSLLSSQSSSITDDVTVVAFSPTARGYFLAGYMSGSCALFNINSGEALCCWYHPAEYGNITSIEWVNNKPGTFFLLFSTGELLVYDLIHNANTATHQVSLTAPPLSNGKVLSIALSHPAKKSLQQTYLAMRSETADPSAMIDIHVLRNDIALSSYTHTEADTQQFLTWLQQLR